MSIQSPRLTAAGVAALAGLALGGLAGQACAKEPSAAAFMAAANTNKDSTLSKDEVSAYARKTFAKIEADHDKTLDEKELMNRMTAAGMAAADTDKDKTVDESEFVAYAGKLFDEANADSDKTLSVKELESPAGQKLRMLLQ